MTKRAAAKDGGLWHEAKDPNERAKRIAAVVDSLHVTTEARRRRILRHLRQYEGRMLPDLTPTAYFDGPSRATGVQPSIIQLPRAIVDTACAKIAGKQKPKAMFAVSNGDWQTKRRAKKMERAIEAVMAQRHGLSHDAYGVLLEAFRDTGYADCGAVKWFADFEARRVTCERMLPWELLVDPRECRGGPPLNWFHRYGYDRFKLAAKFPQFEDQIMAAPAIPDVYGASTRGVENDRHGRMVLVIEGWRVAISDDLPGTHCIAVGGIDLTEGEEWPWTFPPIELTTWAPWRMGIFGTSLIEIVSGLCEEVNDQVERWRQNEKLGSNMYGVCEDDSVREEDMRSNKAMTWMRHKKGSPAPQITVPQTFGSASMQYLERMIRLVFDIPGISQADAQSEREPGLQSGEAQRIVANIKSERFSVQWQNYERMAAVGSARQILRCLQQLADDGSGGDVVIRSAKGSELREFRWKDFALEIPDESIQIAAVSGLVNSPADRVDVAERLFAMGILSPAGVRRVIQAQDLDSELAAEDAQSRLVETYIESWLDPSTKAEQKKFQYRPPKKWMDLAEAIVQVGRAMFEAEADGAPDWNLQWFVKFLEDCDRVMDQIAARKAEIQAAAGGNSAAIGALGPTGPGGPPGPPPGPPGPAGPSPILNGAAPPIAA